jgi:hypothetical protein
MMLSKNFTRVCIVSILCLSENLKNDHFETVVANTKDVYFILRKKEKLNKQQEIHNYSTMLKK